MLNKTYKSFKNKLFKCMIIHCFTQQWRILDIIESVVSVVNFDLLL